MMLKPSFHSSSGPRRSTYDNVHAKEKEAIQHAERIK
jgi:hypothetical protein